ncbi:poly(glycerol-phosphate) alpha-glucosyltransferase [Isoptericola jiangsuensis]|uniref:Poly(Glycerol-phosphate) alpha-glucosyltransferase n=1 Tax=Isoptericola jiangsuensis TaxID=548579 RepID=A0A2A9EZ80_9MICO|nr:glycosyltransferase [Isoptericola jiangsuensis]PFG44063.1 poly(glycerol-phosphate) alpha-glucosyltransferase [Isoptericola jiangsuensis]
MTAPGALPRPAGLPDAPPPAGGLATATWSVPHDFGGMTSALLRRSRILAAHLDAPVRILTYSPGLDVDEARRRLTRRGDLVDGVTLHNVWEDLRDLPDEALDPRGDEAPGRRPRGRRGELTREEPDGTGGVRTLVFRRDRSLLAVEERQGARRTVATFTRTGRPGRTWPSRRAFHLEWTTQVLPDDPTFVVVDSKVLIRFFASLRDVPSLRTLHLVHGAHLSTDAQDAHGELVGRRSRMLGVLADYDGVVLLTPTQERELSERLGPGVRTFVVPNSTELGVNTALTGRDPARGVVVAGLHPRKRIDHAIAAVDAVRRRTGRPLRLDVYGDGPERAALRALAARAPGVRLRGHVPGAADRFADASFMLLTSTSEGMALVLAEAMARGCLPIAYDIRYGPADVITHGVDGFLVPAGDTESLAAAIEHVTGLDEATLVPMRQAAVRSAQRFDDARVAQRWAEVAAEIANRPR